MLSCEKDNLGDSNCSVCGDNFENESQFYEHLQMTSHGAAWSCTLCKDEQTSFTSEDQLRIHESLYHNLERRFRCSKCDLHFERASQLDYHGRRLHLGEKSQMCQICGKSFFRKNDLKTHLNIHLGSSQLDCKICGQKFNHVSNLIRHSRVHTGLKPYPCSICGKRFTQISSVTRHKRLHGENSGSSGENQSKYGVDKLMKRRHFCKICGDTFPFVVLLRLHERLHVESNDTFQCDTYKMEFHTQRSLQDHNCRVDGFRSKQRNGVAVNSQESWEQSVPPRDSENSVEKISYLPSDSNSTAVESGSEVNSAFRDLTNKKSYVENIAGHENFSSHHHEKPIGKCLHIEGSQLYIEVCEADYLNSLGLSTLESQENNFREELNSHLLDNAPTLRLVQTDLGQQLYELEVNYLSQKYIDQSKPSNSSEESEVCSVNKDVIGQPDSCQNVIHSVTNYFAENSRTVELDAPTSAVSRNPDNSTLCEGVSHNQQEHQTPMVRLVQNEEGEQFFELVRDPIDYADANKQSQFTQKSNELSSKESSQEIVINDKNGGKVKMVNSNAIKKIKRKIITKTKGQEQKFECEICKKKFSTATNLKQHAGTHFLDKQKFHCKECAMSFAWKSTLNKHLASNHRPDGPQKFVCEICPKVYCTLSQVNEHVKRDHLKERNHVCQECGKSFFKKFDLKSHIRTHTKERPYICRICDKKFYHQSHIIRHERIHSGERPYVCGICQKTFTQLSSLKVHKQRHQNVTKIDILDYQNNEDDPIALGTL